MSPLPMAHRGPTLTRHLGLAGALATATGLACDGANPNGGQQTSTGSGAASSTAMLQEAGSGPGTTHQAGSTTGVGGSGTTLGSSSAGEADCIEVAVLQDNPDIDNTCDVPLDQLWTRAWLSHWQVLDTMVATAWFGVGECPGTRRTRLSRCTGDVLEINGQPAGADGGLSIAYTPGEPVNFALQRGDQPPVTWTIVPAEPPELLQPMADATFSRSDEVEVRWTAGTDPEATMAVVVEVQGGCYPEFCGDTNCILKIYDEDVPDDGEHTIDAGALLHPDLSPNEDCHGEIQVVRRRDWDDVPEALSGLSTLRSISRDNEFQLLMTP